MILKNGLKCLKLIALIGLITGQTLAENRLPTTIRISRRFSEDRLNLITNDLDSLIGMPKWSSLNSIEKRVFEMEDPTSTDLFRWITERVHFLLPDANPHPLGLSYGKAAKYPEEGLVPKNLSELFLFMDQTSRTVMSNYGVSYYYIGKSTGRVINVNLRNHFPSLGEKIEVISPRIGIVAIDENFFKSHLYISKLGRNESDTISRLSHVFHEARHSDGNGESLGFYHTECPPGSDYAGKLACDKSSNGPYAIGSIFLKKSAEVCVTCNDEEKDLLRLQYFDSKERILDRKYLTPQEVEEINNLENEMNELSLVLFEKLNQDLHQDVKAVEAKILAILEKIRLIQKPLNEVHQVFWDANPEIISLDFHKEAENE